MTRRPRIVAIGDLNGAADALSDILQGVRVMNARGRWTGGRDTVIQLGDIFNRGSGAREAFTMLLRLQREARRAGGEVVVLLGNHEAMTTLRNEAYCTEGEYLAFASAAARRAWPARVHRQIGRIARRHPPAGPIAPIAPRLELWKIEHVPGRAEMRRALSPTAPLGRAVRRLPVVVRRGGIVFVHAGLSTRWARFGVDGLNRMAAELWASGQRFLRRLPRTCLFRAAQGPLWDRSYAVRDEAAWTAELIESLRLLDAKRMVVGHTATPNIEGGEAGRVLLRHGGRIAFVDVGIEAGPASARAALIVEGGYGTEWTPAGSRLLWRDP